MIVCAHGNVTEYCNQHDMVICECYHGEITEYNGNCPVIVTDLDISENHYIALKISMIKRGIEVVSTRYGDRESIASVINHVSKAEQRTKSGGRIRFGYWRLNGVLTENPEEMKVVRRIFDLRDSGSTLREISEDEGVHRLNGDPLSVSTIQGILKNRNEYERGL